MDYNAEIDELADRLIVRHLRVSIPDPRTRRELQRVHKPEPLLEQRVRCIAVVGAGASAPLLGRGNELVKDLEREFAAEEELREEESYRLQRVYGLDPEDFETRIAALSRTPEITRHVREAISKRYVARHPTILGYELLAHLLKHRFLDAIVSFNFDELLDQSLDDELGQNAYRRLVSDRDCPGVVTNPDAPDYLPLYIKLHGTATEPDSLRLTREAYYKLSQQLMEVVGELFEGQTTVVLNLGSAMTGFDLQRLLRIPERLEIFDLSVTPLEKPVQKAIRSERRAARPDSFHPGEDREKPDFFLPAEDLAEKKNEQWSCDEWLKQLTNAMGRRSGKGPKKQIDPNSLARLVDFRPVDRHEAVADVLGPAATLSRWLKDPEKHRAEYADYLRKRTIVELALSGAKARGLAQLSWLAIDRSGSYFELYRREGRTSELESWSSLRMASGLDENTSLPDVVESHPNLCESGARPTLDQGTWALREFIPDLLAKQVMTSVGRHGAAVKNRFSSTLRNLQKGSEVEIHATDDRVCVKAFDAPLTLPTLTALKVFTAALFNGIRPEDEVYISCETGEWLLRKEGTMFDRLSKQKVVRVLTAFESKSADLEREYGGRLKLHSLDPWRHNRHMTIVCRGSQPMRAVYFARRLRTPIVTPVYLKEVKDAERVKRAFDLMLAEAEKEEVRKRGKGNESP